MNNPIPAWLTELRSAVEIYTQAQIADVLQLDRSSISSYLGGKTIPRPRVIADIMNTNFRAALSWKFGDGDDEEDIICFRAAIFTEKERVEKGLSGKRRRQIAWRNRKREIAAAAGVSEKTLDRIVYQDYVPKKGTREKILRAMKEVKK